MSASTLPCAACQVDVPHRQGLDELWAAALRASNRAEKTVINYTLTLRLFGAAVRHEALCLLCCGAYEAEQWLADELIRCRTSTVATRYRHLRLFFRWAIARGLRLDDPLAETAPPTVFEMDVPVIEPVDARSLIAATDGDSVEDVRDRALLELFAATPLRLSELSQLGLSDYYGDRLTVTGKASRPRVVPIDDRARLSVEAWLGIRPTMKFAKLDAMWLSRRGRLTSSGIYQVVRRRARAAGVEHMHPHRWRHTFAHQWLLGGNSEGDLMMLAGWRSRQMLDRYGRSAATVRATEAYRRAGVRADRDSARK